MSYCELPPKFFSASWQKARKDHRCCECFQTIHKGETYGKFNGLWDNNFNCYKQHLECEDACVFIRDMNGECLCFGELFENEIDWTHRKQKNELRSLMARAIWRKEKGYELKWLKINRDHESMRDLDGLRKRGRVC